MKDGRVLLSDVGRHSLFLCDSDGNVSGSLNFKSNCWGVSRLLENTFIATELHNVVCFNQNKLNITTRVPMDRKVYGRSIAHDSVKGGCVMAAEDKIVTINRNGKLKEIINMPDETRGVTSVCTVGTKIWYGDWYKNSVHCMIREGKAKCNPIYYIS